MRLFIFTFLIFFQCLNSSFGQVQYTYDDFNRLVKVIYPDNSVIEYSYDKLGNRTQLITVAQRIKLNVKIMLQGAFDSSTQLMKDDLRLGDFLPTSEPFTSLGFNYVSGGGGETVVSSNVFTKTGNDAIVDWVVIESVSYTHLTLPTKA